MWNWWPFNRDKEEKPKKKRMSAQKQRQARRQGRSPAATQQVTQTALALAQPCKRCNGRRFINCKTHGNHLGFCQIGVCNLRPCPKCNKNFGK